MPQSQADKLIGRVAQPLSRHFNGQGMVQASDYVPLTDEDFGSTFMALWDAHINFGTSRSHKKLLGKKRQPAAAVESGGIDDDARGVSQKRKHDEIARSSARVKTDGTASAISKAPTPAAPPAAAAQPLANKGRFAGTLAARLLGGQ